MTAMMKGSVTVGALDIPWVDVGRRPRGSGGGSGKGGRRQGGCAPRGSGSRRGAGWLGQRHAAVRGREGKGGGRGRPGE